MHSFGGWTSFGPDIHRFGANIPTKYPISVILNERIDRAEEIARILEVLQSVATPKRRTRWGIGRSIRRNQCRNEHLDTFPRSQHGSIIHLAIDARFQQEIREPPDIVQQHRKHEVKQADAIIL